MAGEKLMKVVVLGKLLGTATGWDDQGEQCICFYNFTPSDQASSLLPSSCCLEVDFGFGCITLTVDSDGNQTATQSIFNLSVLDNA